MFGNFINICFIGIIIIVIMVGINVEEVVMFQMNNLMYFKIKIDCFYIYIVLLFFIIFYNFVVDVVNFVVYVFLFYFVYFFFIFIMEIFVYSWIGIDRINSICYSVDILVIGFDIFF